jgi:hypothetical protein
MPKIQTELTAWSLWSGQQAFFLGILSVPLGKGFWNCLNEQSGTDLGVSVVGVWAPEAHENSTKALSP